MSLILPKTNFATWKTIQAGYLYPKDCDDNNHIYVAGSIWNGQIDITAVAIKTGGTPKTLGVGSAITAFQYKPFPGTSQDYLDALRAAAVIA